MDPILNDNGTNKSGQWNEGQPWQGGNLGDCRMEDGMQVILYPSGVGQIICRADSGDTNDHLHVEVAVSDASGRLLFNGGAIFYIPDKNLPYQFNGSFSFNAGYYASAHVAHREGQG